MAAGGASRAARRVRAAYAALACLTALWPVGFAAGAEAKKPAAGSAPTVAEIVAKNVAARGGLDAWRKVETMVWTGHLESARTPAPSMPFLLDQKRPNKTRFELHALREHTVRVFDGTHGWKSQSGGGVQPSVKPFTAEEVRFARGEHTIDGPLIDVDAKGNQVALAGVEQLDGHKVYHLSLKFMSGEREEVWVDAKTFLEVKVARLTFGPNGAPRMVPTLYRDYKDVEGLKIPMTIQIGDGSSGPPDRMQIDRVALNITLDDRLFAKPGTTGRHHASSQGTEPAAAEEAAPLFTPRTPAPPAAVKSRPDQ